MYLHELKITETRREKLREKMREKGYHYSSNPWIHEPDYMPQPEESKYDYKVEILKWNTRSSRLIRLAVRWDEKKDDWVISYWKQGSTHRINNCA